MSRFYTRRLLGKYNVVKLNCNKLYVCRKFDTKMQVLYFHKTDFYNVIFMAIFNQFKKN